MRSNLISAAARWGILPVEESGKAQWGEARLLESLRKKKTCVSNSETCTATPWPPVLCFSRGEGAVREAAGFKDFGPVGGASSQLASSLPLCTSYFSFLGTSR